MNVSYEEINYKDSSQIGLRYHSNQKLKMPYVEIRHKKRLVGYFSTPKSINDKLKNYGDNRRVDKDLVIYDVSNEATEQPRLE